MKFEQLRVTEQLLVAITVIAWFGRHRCASVDGLATARAQSVQDLWRDICVEVGVIPCDPWQGYPAPPQRNVFAEAPVPNRDSQPDWEHSGKLIERLAAPFDEAPLGE